MDVLQTVTWRIPRLLAAGVLTAGIGSVAVPAHALAGEEVHRCSGTAQHPGVLAGSFDSVLVRGWCAVNGGLATVDDDLTVGKDSVLVAAFALNDVTGKGTSRLRVEGDLQVRDGGTLILGCLASSFPCLDDPNPSKPTLASHAYVGEDLTGDEPLGLLVHNATVGEDVFQTGGGGGKTCKPQGPFALFQSPVYSAYEDSSIGGELVINKYRSCWLGVIRNHIGDDASLRDDQLADPDAIEILANRIEGDLACRGNSMAWDGHELGQHLFPREDVPNKVGDDRSGQCVRSTPTTKGGPYGPPDSF
jgi:hypothetical protein